MILESRLIALVLALRFFLCALCNDDALATSKGTTIAVSARLHYDSQSTGNPGMIHDRNLGSAENGLASQDAIATSIGSTVEPLTTVSQPVTDDDKSSTSTTVDRITWFTTVPNPVTSTNDDKSSTFTYVTVLGTTLFTTVPNPVTSTDNAISTTICDPTWPINASADTREVVNLRTDEIGTDWITLSWESPCNVTSDSVIYSIERCDDKNCILTNETFTWHNATDLDPCTQYTFKVKILTKFWESDGVDLSVTTTISEIGDVVSVSVRTISVSAIQLTWQAPATHAKCISNYTIAQCIEKSCNEIVVPANETNYVASELEPCTEYHFTIKAVTPFVKSAGVNQTAKTASPKLSAPQSFHVIPGNFSLIVKWEPPESGTVCLKHYRVTTDFNRYSENTTSTSVTIFHLHACETYQVYLNAVNKDDEEGEMIDKSGTTLAYITNPPVAATTGILSRIKSLSIIWTIQKENNHCQLSSIVTKCNYTEKKGKGYEPTNSVVRTEIDSNAIEPTIEVNVTVEELSPYTIYTCWANVVNIAGYSDFSDGINATTLEDVPSAPEVCIKNVTDSQFSLSWEEPTILPGHLEEFEIIIDWNLPHPIPSWCSREQDNEKKFPVNGSEFEYVYREAKAFTNYTVTMKAKTGEGWSNSSNPQIFLTHSAVPEAVSKFNFSSITIKESSKDANVLDTILTWGFPCSLNGELEFFNVSRVGTRNKYPDDVVSKEHYCRGNNDYMCSINLNELKAEYNYTFTISAKVKDVDTLGPPVSQNVLYPAGIPPQPKKEYIKAIVLDPYKIRRSTTTATILLPLFLNTNGDIKFYAIMVAKMGCNIQANTRFELKNWPNASSWEEAMMSDFSITYQATPSWWNPHPNHNVSYGHVEAVKYTIGEDLDCKEISSNIDEPVYCNGPLKPDTWYHVRMRAFTAGGYSDSETFSIKTDAELNVALVIGAVFGILFVGILATMMLLVRKCSPHIVFRRFLHSDMPGSPVPAPFTRKKFISHCQQLVDNPGKLSNEFRLLQTLSVDLQMPTNTACLQANRKKNRYSDILPYDFSRVKLEVIDNDPNTDYINASFIKGYTGEDEYIACQGPKEETTYDFWRMINQYNINIIVMLTQLVEKGKEKCHQYYPTIKESFRYENMMIRCTSELDFRTHTQRTLVLQKENKKRIITHLHFKDWPDHDVPEDFEAMINFCQIMRRNITANKGFIVVHCSAGIGRTGTLIAIDILLQQIRDNRKLDVFGTVYRLRHHRINMVQRESQYAYIYNCIKQVLKNPYFLKTYKPPPVEPIYENTSKKAKDTNSDTNLVNNLEILKKHNTISMKSLESMSFNHFPWSTSKSVTMSSDLRQCKSMGAINVKAHHTTVGKSRTLDCIFKPLRDSSYELNRENLIQESLPLLTCSRSTDVLGDSVQYATNSNM